MMKNEVSPYQANQDLDENHQHHPHWCYYRMGQSETVLPDGTNVLIAGEHEDSYDPDFFIYNDVTVIRPDGEITFFGYSEYLFPPTDNHSATLVGDQIYIIGCLGYPHQRHKDKTPVYSLNINDFHIHKVSTKGLTPSWLHSHAAQLSQDGKSIICEGGDVIHPSGNYVENLAKWNLELETGIWTKLSEKKWTRWKIYREDSSRNDLSNISDLQYAQKLKSDNPRREYLTPHDFITEIKARGHEIDLSLYENRHIPPMPHERIGEDENNFRHFRVAIEGVICRIVEGSHEIEFNIEGNLPEEMVKDLQAHYLDIYSKLEGMPYTIEQI